VHRNGQSPSKYSLSGRLIPNVCSCRLGYGPFIAGGEHSVTSASCPFLAIQPQPTTQKTATRICYIPGYLLFACVV
jgi:hypothetical protein